MNSTSPEGLASRWYPLGQNRPVVLDPTVAFGAPSIAGRGVKTINIHDLFVAENENLAPVRAWWDLTDDGDPGGSRFRASTGGMTFFVDNNLEQAAGGRNEGVR